ncbi:glycosyltransferase [Paenibacillus oenotherae]|uniref:Glycosyltransferase n=1 Tax=Paenibacillus oenotherae TaxID=1435645 RepID=A0ABS7D5E1_9BACL|nr:glycosyltransferase [Paenibacillus oenotherae]MBW7475172.1 glycosyltransferase [Paenibacillus oenotherae]
MITVSLCMIVKNEEETLGRCLGSVAQHIDEIIIVDTGSTDGTVAVARQFTDRIHHFAWIDDFAAARNYAFSLATSDYILWLDSDDIFREKDREQFKALLQTLDPAVDSVSMPYILSTDEFGNSTSVIRRNRLVKRAKRFQWIGPVHEYLLVHGRTINSDIAVTHCSIRHDSDRNIAIYEKRLAADEKLSPRDLFYYANELKDHARYREAITYYEKFIATGDCWIEDLLSCCGRMADCYHELNDPQRELESTLRAFQYAAPRADSCCRLGYYFLQKNDLAAAVHWYETAAALPQPHDAWGFTNRSCSTWLPHLQLCVCYDRLGNYELAHQHNEKAGEYRPTDQRILYNRSYLQPLIQPSSSRSDSYA